MDNGDTGNGRRRLAAALAGLALAALLGRAATAPAQDVELRAKGDTVTCNRFSITRLPAPAEGEGMGRLRLDHDGREAARGDVTRVDRLDTTLRLAWPTDDAATLLVTTFSGGAHCCFATWLLTMSPASDTAVRLGLEHGPAPVPGDDGTLAVVDWTFAYYAAPDGTTGFSFAGSPAMKRQLVHDASGWRPDRPGEYPQTYRDRLEPLAKKAARVRLPAGRDNPALAALMEATYYRLMAGEDEQATRAKWRSALAGRGAAGLDAVFADVVKAVREYNPVTPVDLSGGSAVGE